MRNQTIFIFIFTLLSSNALAGNYANWQEHSHAYLADQKLLIEQQNLGTGTVVTVGSDNNCDFSIGPTIIQDAIDSGADEIRIMTDTYFENLEIIEVDVILIGGFANCADAVNNITDGNRATVDGGNNAPVINIRGLTESNNISISNMLLSNGNGVINIGGGIVIRSADVAINLNNVWLSNNNASIRGGGIEAVGGTITINAKDVNIFENTALRGGGIYCTGNNNSIMLSGDSGVYNNEATSTDGGGVLLQGGCEMTSYVGRRTNSQLSRGIFDNQAQDNGGGVAVYSGSRLSLIGSQFCNSQNECIGNNNEPASISNNIANSNNDSNGIGGGVYATGANAVVDAFNIDIYNNTARHGGGIAIEDEAILNTGLSNPICWSPGSCNQISNNKALDSGGGIYATGSNTVGEVDVTHIQGNRANTGTAVYVRDDAEFSIKSSVISGNGNGGNDGYADLYPLNVFGADANNTHLNIQASTIVDNNTRGAVLLNTEGMLSVNSSILHNPSNPNVYLGTDPVANDFNCVMVNELASTPQGLNIVEDDPEFVDRINGDFHLNAMLSPAIDFCDNTGTTEELTDIDAEQRGWDDPNVSDINGPYDIGADESYDGDIIFANSFEN